MSTNNNNYILQTFPPSNFNENKPQDIYQNAATAQINIGTEEIVSPIVKVQVVKRTIDGKNDKTFRKTERMDRKNEIKMDKRMIKY